MAENLRSIADQLDEKHPIGAALIRGMARTLKEYNLIPDRISPQVVMDDRTTELKRALNTLLSIEKPKPEDLSAYWATRWSVLAERARLEITVPPCDRTAKEIEALKKEGRRLVYVPDTITLVDLGKIHPEMRSSSLQPNAGIQDESDTYGWLDVEAGVDCSYLGTTEAQLRRMLEEKGVSGMREKTYIVASQDCFDRTNKY
ncbi:MAG: hypothetical protein ACMG6E_03990, partial [Candidatus Roizmanbacteria bacterium]